MNMQLTLSMIKPDAVTNHDIGGILRRIEAAGLEIVALKMLQLSQADAENFYAVHRERPFFAELVQFMTSAPVVVAVLRGDEAINKYRSLMGATDPAEAVEGTIRAEFAATKGRNAVHGSDSIESAAQEIAFFFSTREIFGRGE